MIVNRGRPGKLRAGHAMVSIPVHAMRAGQPRRTDRAGVYPSQAQSRMSRASGIAERQESSMVTPLASVRLMSAQLLVKAINQEASQTSGDSSSSTASRLLAGYGIDASSSSTLSGSTLSGLLDATANASANTATQEEESDDITTASFMAKLRETLEEMSGAAGGNAQADAMLAALEAGTLKVSDPVNGVEITAWNVGDSAEKDTTQKDGTDIGRDGWSAFLREHLKRGENVAYARTADGSYIDAVTGANAWFGNVGSTWYYLSWNAPSAA